MLTSYQAEVVAAVGDGELICIECLEARLDRGEDEPWREFAARVPDEWRLLSRYEVTEINADALDGTGVWCDECGDLIDEPFELEADDEE
jgi:hypothetical protein